MTVPAASLEASRLSSQLKATASTACPWPCRVLTVARAERPTSKKCTQASSLPVTGSGEGGGENKVRGGPVALPPFPPYCLVRTYAGALAEGHQWAEAAAQRLLPVPRREAAAEAQPWRS